jgi:hypothetical protein
MLQMQTHEQNGNVHVTNQRKEFFKPWVIGKTDVIKTRQRRTKKVLSLETEKVKERALFEMTISTQRKNDNEGEQPCCNDF